MTTEQLKQLKTTYVYVAFFNENKKKTENIFIGVPFCYNDLSELDDYQLNAVCQAELAKFGYGYDIRSIDIDKFYNPGIINFEEFQKKVAVLKGVIDSERYTYDNSIIQEACEKIEIKNERAYVEEVVNMILSIDDNKLKKALYYGCFEEIIGLIIRTCNDNSYIDLIEKLRGKWQEGWNLRRYLFDEEDVSTSEHVMKGKK